jgi:hypothetical protein
MHVQLRVWLMASGRVIWAQITRASVRAGPYLNRMAFRIWIYKVYRGFDKKIFPDPRASMNSKSRIPISRILQFGNKAVKRKQNCNFYFLLRSATLREYVFIFCNTIQNQSKLYTEQECESYNNYK